MESILGELYFGNIDMNMQRFNRNSDIAKAMDTLVLGEDRLEQLGRFDKAKFEYLHSQKFELYREFLLIDKLAEHCENIEKQADKMYEKLFQKYLNDHDVPNGDDFFASTSMFEQADRWAREIVINNVICN